MKQYSGNLLNFCRGAAVGVSMIFASFGAFAEGAISAISASVQAGVETLKIDFTDAPSVLPTGFATQSRIQNAAIRYTHELSTASRRQSTRSHRV